MKHLLKEMKANVVCIIEMGPCYKLNLLYVIFQIIKNSHDISLKKISNHYTEKNVLSLWFHGSCHMLISVQYQVSLFHKPSGRLTSCISPDGPPYQPSPFHGTTPSWQILECFDIKSQLRKESVAHGIKVHHCLLHFPRLKWDITS